MEIKNILVTGEAFFLERHRHLFNAMASHFQQLEYLPHGKLNKAKLAQKVKKVLPKFIVNSAEKIVRKNQQTFILKSQQTEQKISELQYQPDFIFHIFGMYSPLWHKSDIPYAMYLDYTMALTARNWSAWAPFSTPEQLDFWLNCERHAYTKAHHLFVMSTIVKNSLIKDYSVLPEKITVVGSSGNFDLPYEGEKTFGTKQILFNGSDFERKGGNLVLASFKKVKQVLPDAKLVIIGKKLTKPEDGVDDLGYISSATTIRNLFLTSDLVVSPAYCDPFPGFLIEAMNYGVPCLVSEQDGMAEIVDHQVNGIVISQPTADILAAEIINTLCDRSKLIQMSQKAKAKVNTKLNWDYVANNIVNTLLYQPQQVKNN